MIQADLLLLYEAIPVKSGLNYTTKKRASELKVDRYMWGRQVDMSRISDYWWLKTDMFFTRSDLSAYRCIYL